MTTSANPVKVDSRGRISLPADLRRAAGIGEGSELVAVSLGPGRLLLETQQAITEAVWAAAPVDDEADSVADVRRMRDEDVAISEEAADRRRVVDADEAASRKRGEALLSELGLD
jgi:AbrB family looped-hinge helix DNA binding protein